MGSIGFIGEIDPTIVEFERVPFRVFAFELDLESLEDEFQDVYRYTINSAGSQLSPATLPSWSASRFRTPISWTRSGPPAGPTLEYIRLVDQYQGSQVPPGHQSLAFHMLFRDPERTLTAEEVAETVTRIVAALKDRFGAELRS